jgi:hypothetical protein
MQTDEGVQNTYYADADQDGFGDPNSTIMDCSLPDGYVTDNTDCDDTDGNEYPGQMWYLDGDGDGYSDGTSTMACERPADYYLASELTATSGDCDDSDGAINPGATEVCDGVDNNCNMQTDEGVQNTYYADTDQDGFGDPDNPIMDCNLPAGYVTDNTDCDDTDGNEYPGQTWYLDGDGDGYSDGTSTMACERPADYYLASELTATSGDCDDSDGAINPGATEVCDGVDNNCNMQTDEGLTSIYYADLDMDGYGDENNTVMACEAPEGYVTNDEDCDDNDPEVNPDAIEVCNGIDDNCNGLIDGEDPGLKSIWQYDDVTQIVGAEGSATYDPCSIDNSLVTLNYFSPNLNTSVDNHGFLHTTLCGDGEVSFKVESVSNYAYVGLTMRASTDPSSKQVSLFSNLSNVLRWETRYNNNSPIQVNSFYKPFPFWIKLVRQGNWVYGYYSTNGNNWSIVHAVQVYMEPCIEAGISIWSYYPGTTETVTVSNVSLLEYSSPAAEIVLPDTEPQVLQQYWSIFPNPARSEITLDWEEGPAPQRVRIYDQMGRMVETVDIDPFHSGRINIAIEHLHAGMYWLELGDGQKRAFVKK